MIPFPPGMERSSIRRWSSTRRRLAGGRHASTLGNRMAKRHVWAVAGNASPRLPQLPKLKFSPKGHDRRLVAEMWLYPDNTRTLALDEVQAERTFLVAAGARAFLLRRGI